MLELERRRVQQSSTKLCTDLDFQRTTTHCVQTEYRNDPAVYSIEIISGFIILVVIYTRPFTMSLRSNNSHETHFLHNRRSGLLFFSTTPIRLTPPPPSDTHTLSIRRHTTDGRCRRAGTHLLHTDALVYRGPQSNQREGRRRDRYGLSVAPMSVNKHTAVGVHFSARLRVSCLVGTYGLGAINSRIFTTGHSASFHKLYEITNVRVRYTARHGRMWAKQNGRQ